jgi:hypothetical protein
MPLYACTILLSAFLLFLVQPIVAKLILPWFGGSAGVWTICLVFFQVVLLLGYLYAHGIARHLHPRRQSLLHIILLAASLLLLPIVPGAAWKPAGGTDPTWRILILLTVCLGLPYFLLSATTPLLQSWYAQKRPTALPYRLFALSNTASLLALVSYPAVVEPRTQTHSQAVGWSIAYTVFVVLCMTSAWLSRTSRSLQPHGESTGAHPRPPWTRQGVWLLLAACGSMLLLAITNHLTQNIAAVPFLWILPLVLYLLTFCIAFGASTRIPRWIVLRLLAVALGSMAYLLYETGFAHVLQIGIPVFASGLFIACLFCNGELNRTKPHARHLTLFYLMISLGGAIGALFAGLAAPRLFTAPYELPLALLLTAVLATVLTWKEGWGPRILWLAATAGVALLIVTQVRQFENDSLVILRNFYGTLRVKQSGGLEIQIRTLYHGTVAHGSQFLLAPRRLQPTTYYARNSGAGIALDSCCPEPKRVGVIGLGAGTVAVYGRPGDVFRFYEINPQVEHIARSVFTYLKESQAKVEVILGDARLSLESEPPQHFDVLLIDAFSGDAIPMHLLTKEAVSLYLGHLKPTGILAFHVSNTYLDLAPVVRQLAEFYGKQSLLVHSNANSPEDETAADWVLTGNRPDLFRLRKIEKTGKPIPLRPELRIWTDDYSSLLQVLKGRQSD